MRLEWLEDILAVAETGSLSDAADRRNLTQSAFSRRIRAIEDYVGIPLFDRARKPMQLRATTAAQQDQVARLANDLRQLVFDLRRGDRAASNRIIFASQHALTTSLTPELLNFVGREAPEIYVRLRSANQDECFGLLLSRQADLAFVYRLQNEEHPVEADFVETLVLGQDRLIPVFAAEKSAALNASFQSGELPVIAYPGDVFLGQVLDNRILPAVRRLVQATPKVETALTLAALELARVGLGIAWVPFSLARADLEAGRLIDLSRTLSSATLEVTAVRVTGSPNPAVPIVWGHLLSISNDQQIVFET